MNFKKFLIAAAPAALLLASCASDDPNVTPGDGGVEGKSMYAKIRVRVPSTRSNTITPDGNTNSNAGYEVGQPYENDIKNVTLVLATYENGVYTPKAVSSNSVATMPDPVASDVYTIMFEDEQIKELKDQKVYIFAYCNTDLDPSAIMNNFNDLADMKTTIASAAVGQGIWQSGNFMMVNAPNQDEVPSKDMPDERTLINNFNSPEKALNLGTVDVARVAARFDYKVTNDNKYEIVDATDGTTVLANVELTDMAPLNIAKTFYTLPRVSADGTDNAWTICGNEVFDNYVVSPFFRQKQAADITSLFDNFFFPTANSPLYDTYSYTNINTWYNDNTTQDDNDENWNAEKKEGYKIWRYVTENTIPGVDEQRKGISTGVVFRGKITNAKGLMGEAMAAKQAVYAYSGTYYGGIANLRRVVANLDESAKMREDFLKVFPANYLSYEMVKEGEKLVRKYEVADEDLKDCTSAENNSVFKILRPSADGEYYVYYVYRNRHNDNGKATVMGPMEFATVRNNVYKLAVTMVSDFGHTNDPMDDTEPDDPNEEDETPKTYFKVSCHVLPWIVRVNNIDF